MSTEVVVTGTGTPAVNAHRAGAGVLVRTATAAVQIDAGRATTLRLAAADQALVALDAVCITHHHSDHLVGLVDLVMARWLHPQGAEAGPLVVVCPEGPASRFVERCLDPYDEDITVRMEHVDRPDRAEIELRTFTPGATPAIVFEAGDLVVEAVRVHHEPVEPAVAYRITTPDGVAVVSGDTRVCDEVERLAFRADVLVHEAARIRAMEEHVVGTPLASILDYHTDSVDLGGLAERAQVKQLVLTHLVPAPATDEARAGFVDDLRSGGFTGSVVAADDLHSERFGSD